jgi:hypothetical protein
MPAAIDTQVKKEVINQWLSGDSRDRIAADNGLGAGTVSNVINELKRGVEDTDYDSVRELAVYSSCVKKSIPIFAMFLTFLDKYQVDQNEKASQYELKE